MNSLIGRLSALSLLVFSCSAQAGVMVFTDEAEWEAAVSNSYLTETFDSMPNTHFVEGINNAGLIEVEISNDPLMNGLDNGDSTGFQVNGTRFLVGNHGFDDDTSVTLRFRDPITAFAAHWTNTTTAANLSIMIAGETISFSDHLNGSGDGFLGFLSDTNFDQAAFGVDGAPPGGEGFALDNLSIATPVPEPHSFGLLALALAGIAWLRESRRAGAA
ncbi:MAG: PEP-CTERM sorting domain-containing protein [Pseudomonadales bacterium]